MAVNKVIYGSNTLIDLTADTVTEESLLEGYIAHKADGSVIVGNFKGGSVTEEIDRILTSGLIDGYKYFLDDGTIVSNSPTTGLKLTKNFSEDFSVCTTVLTDQNGVELGRTEKRYSGNCHIVTTTDHIGRKLVKTFSSDFKTLEAILTDENGIELARYRKTFSDDQQKIETVVTYGQEV